ncbi:MULTISPECIES: LysR substrate-binding domain-containing protein [Pseudomonas]|jgi:DNA-binding transcriptional LysR family regulator|uniref:LysR family transcriptional regulator n=1 Tax=Pseudomonas hunanensis TaxID=1247546 RepID=A0ABD6NEQ1_9PSED|nr:MULTISPECIES: LysR substrate-binding domain-containing protein [Pseudomonas]AYN13328.1 LysR family transcriptional regulator [Pseudomonas putida]MCF1253032.1 LysR family transcriptional regulator [Pseudomonas putida]MDD2144000.1 LysR substrate-binding domain-containing protein [Pseudomonas putida]MDH1691875.1 LysR substrate-binding domain-containing protein [Pseudomonas sp. GD03766]NWL47832.1 LysR family transcriptional regulator [Pseudomonas hunanensis]
MPRQLPPLYALRAFEAAARLSSFTRAGEELSITQSAISRHIRTLEEHFACRLFVRSGRSLQLTEAGRVLLPGVREGFAAFERACETLCGEDEILRMKAPSTLTMRWLLACLSRFRHLQPGNEVQLTSAWMDVDHVDFNQEPFDCAVLLSDGVFPAEWEVRKLFPELLIPVGAPDLLDEEPWDVRRLASIELLHPTVDKRDWREWLERMGLGDEVSLKGGQVFDTLELGMIAAARGYGISMGDLLMVAEDVAQKRLSLPWPTAVPSGMDYYLVWPRTRRGGERLRRLSAFLEGEVAAMDLPDVEILPPL